MTGIHRNRLVLLLGTCATLCLGAAWHGDTARACSPEPTSVVGVAPSDGETQVPTNTRVLVHVRGQGAELPHVEVHGPDGTEVIGSIDSRSDGRRGRVIIWTPTVALEPGTYYEIWSTADGDGARRESPAFFSAFITGAGSDTSAPEPPAAVSLAMDERERSGGGFSTCGGPDHYFTMRLEAMTADDGGVAALAIAPSTSPTNPLAMVEVGGDGAGAFEWTIGCDEATASAIRPGTHVLRAVDHAGNLSEAVVVTVPDVCGDAASCSVGHGRSSWPFLAVAAFVTALLARRRRGQRVS